MPVQALYEGLVTSAFELSYQWAADGTVLLAINCCPGTGSRISYHQLLGELRTLCPWQLDCNVVVCNPRELVEVLTIYHDIGRDGHARDTLTLVSTPPDEYFDAMAA